MSVAFDQILLVPGYRKVAAAIAERILSRELREGERLPSETELARQFGVNRSTVREALRELESGGLLERRPGSKLMTVSRPRHRAVAKDVGRALALHDVTFLEVWEALSHFEPPFAEIAARNRTAADIDSLTAACQLFMADNADTEKAVHYTAEFFRAIAHAAHNQVLGLVQEPLLGLLEPSLRVMIDKVPQARARILAAQRRILEAIARRDAEAARSWMTRHIRDFRKGYELAGIALDCRIA
ncbi:MAG TPA: GntR family transcriptional regulator [Steroidobacteraceae bacterium]|jgi:DNA-binding FadR family transcriptional regulator|nr:GntR family transcriptional regulator [Steroidobacteraceae bacterium]